MPPPRPPRPPLNETLNLEHCLIVTSMMAQETTVTMVTSMMAQDFIENHGNHGN